MSDINKLAELANVDSQELEDLLQFLKAPQARPNFSAALKGVIRMLEAAPLKEFESSEHDALISTAKRLRDTLRYSDSFKSLIATKRASAPKLAHGMLGDYPQYTLLFFEASDNSEIFHQLKKAAWIEDKNVTENDIRDYCRFLRVLSETGIPPRMELSLSTEVLELEDIYRALDNLTIEEDSQKNLTAQYQSNLMNNASSALRLIKQLTGRSVVRRKRTGDAKLMKSRDTFGVRGYAELEPNHYVMDLTFRDKDDNNSEVHVRSYDSLELSESELDELDAAGIEPLEVEKDRLSIWFLDISVPRYAQQFRARKKRIGQQSRIERHNQYLPLSMSRLTVAEVSNLIDLFTKTEVSSKREAAIVVIAVTMLLTSSSFERTKQLIIVPEGVSRRKALGGEEIAYYINHQCWLIPRFLLPFATSELSNTFATEPLKQIGLPVVLPRVQELIKQFFKIDDNTPAKAFRRLNIKADEIARFLRNAGSRITPAKVSNHLISAVASVNGASVAGYLFSRALPGSLARYYYSAHPPEFYRQCYLGAVNRELNIRITAEQTLIPNKQTTADPGNRPYSLGARYVPHTDGVRRAFKDMSHALLHYEDATKKFAFIDIHNMYTAYCIFAQSFLTGIRTVIDPFISRAELLAASDIAVFRDKDTKDQFHTRMLPVHPIALEIADEFTGHRDIVLEKLILLNPGCMRTASVQTAKTFFIDPISKNVLPPQPKIISSCLSRFYSLPLNSNRKLLKSFLEQEMVSPESIDLMLGHHSLGESVGDRMSTFSLSDVRSEVFPKLDRLIEIIGLKVIKGPIA